MPPRLRQIVLYLFLTGFFGLAGLLLIRSGLTAVATGHAINRWSADREISIGPIGNSAQTDHTDVHTGTDAVRFGLGEIAGGTVLAGWASVCLLAVILNPDKHITTAARQRILPAVMIPTTLAGLMAQLCFFPPWVLDRPDLLATVAFLTVLVTITALPALRLTSTTGRRWIKAGAITAALMFVSAIGDRSAAAVLFGLFAGGITSVHILICVFMLSRRPPASKGRSLSSRWRSIEGPTIRRAVVRHSD